MFIQGFLLCQIQPVKLPELPVCEYAGSQLLKGGGYQIVNLCKPFPCLLQFLPLGRQFLF